MKHLRIFTLLLVIIAAVSCGGKDNPTKKDIDITGQWNLSKVETKSASVGGTTVDVYIVFEASNTFTMYQMIGQGRYIKYDGTYTLTEEVLTGKYSDGTAWGSSYNVTSDGTTLTMNPVGSNEYYSYVKKAVPDNIK